MTQTAHRQVERPAVESVLAGCGLTVGEALDLEGLGAGTAAAVFLGGSLADGFGNSSSDVDFYVVDGPTPTGEFVEAGGVRSTFHFVDRRRVAFEYWSSEQILTVAGRLGAVQLEPPRDGRYLPLRIQLSDDEVTLAHRVRVGLPLFGEPALAGLRRSFDYAALCEYLVRSRFEHLDRSLEDLCGMLDDGHRDVGVPAARLCVERAVELLGHHLGGTCNRAKWRMRVLEQHADDPRVRSVRDQAWALLFPGVDLTSDPQAFAAYAEQCMRLCSAITDWVIDEHDWAN